MCKMECYSHGGEEYPTYNKKRKDNWIFHILHMNCLLKHVMEENVENRIEVTKRRGRRCKELMDDLKKMRKYDKLKEEALDRTLWRTRFGSVYGPVVGQSS
jgi:gamma-glutamyl:cysteine ligase YbdK (ATP-grasp superfamily)